MWELSSNFNRVAEWKKTEFENLTIDLIDSQLSFIETEQT